MRVTLTFNELGQSPGAPRVTEMNRRPGEGDRELIQRAVRKLWRGRRVWAHDGGLGPRFGQVVVMFKDRKNPGPGLSVRPVTEKLRVDIE